MSTQTKSMRKWLAMLCAGVVWTSGCFTGRAPAKPVINSIGFAHPVIPHVTSEAPMEPPPAMEFAPPVAPPRLATSHSVPARPRSASLPAAEQAAAEKSPEPTIAPEVTTEEMTTAKAETQHSLGVAEKNLTLARGRPLNATQQDLSAKVRGFTENAREAMRSGDWMRAKSLAKKAEVLSEQLAASL